MGVTIGNKEKSLDCGYAGFNILRTHIAGLISKEFKTFYNEPGIFVRTQEYWDNYDRKLYEVIVPKYHIEEGVLKFLFLPDCDGKLSYQACKQLWNLIKDDNNDFLFGYVGRLDCAKYSEFKEIVKMCAKKPMGFAMVLEIKKERKHEKNK